jgi:hypothetical protein
MEQAEAIVDVAADWGVELTVRPGYSGRGMYGKSVIALVADSISALVMVGFAAGEIGIPFDVLPTRTDSMGLGVVIY